MLGKLIKHEFRATGRVLLPLMAAMLLLCALANLALRVFANGIREGWFLQVVFGLLILLAVLAVMSTAVMAIVIMVSRFYRNLLKDEGYLMFTLPVSVHELLWSKLLVSIVWFLATVLLIWLVLFLTFLNLSGTNLGELLSRFPSIREIRIFLDQYHLLGQISTLLLQGLLMVFLSGIAACLHFYAAMSLGHMFSKDKILLSIVFFVLLSFVLSMIGTGASFTLGRHYAVRAEDVEHIREGLSFASVMLWQTILFTFLQSVLLYLVTVFGLKKGLNLE
ncbi:MAG: hypothetical protein K6C08_15005 [Oscillospiraceae bacterium]|nr:hypothetical protein [Oscillospiraceae bacterium]